MGGDGLGDFISRISLSAATLVLISVLAGGNVLLGLIFFLWMWWAEMLGWGCYFGMAHYSDEHPAPPHSHGDCAGLNGLHGTAQGSSQRWRFQGGQLTPRPLSDLPHTIINM